MTSGSKSGGGDLGTGLDGSGNRAGDWGDHLGVAERLLLCGGRGQGGGLLGSGSLLLSGGRSLLVSDCGLGRGLHLAWGRLLLSVGGDVYRLLSDSGACVRRRHLDL